MEKFDLVFRQLIIVGGVLWLGAAAMQLLGQDTLMVILGVLSILLSVKNIVILNVSARSGNLHPKIKQYEEMYGDRKGLLRYAIVNVLAFLIIGILLIVTSL